MKALYDYILEKYLIDQDTKEEIEVPGKNTKWVAVEITTAADNYHSKDTTSQRVVTVDTYNELKSAGHTKGMMSIKYLDKISPVCNSREAAMNYLDPPQKSVRKSKIDKGGADYIVYCINSGKMNAAGRTNWESFPNFWETWKDCEIYISSYARSFLIGAAGSLKVGDKLVCVDNDSQKKLPGAPNKVEAVCKCNLDEFKECVRKTWPSICNQPKRAFGKEIDGLPWQRMGQFYSIKGIEK